MNEAPMLPMYGLKNMDQFLRAIGDPNLPFGGKIVIFGGDFHQCLPVQSRANRSELVDLSIKKSFLWHYFNFFSLSENMRVDQEQRNFAEYLLNLGNENLPVTSMDEIEQPEKILSSGDLIDEIIGDCLANGRYEDLKDHALLVPSNKDVSEINDKIMDKLSGESQFYKIMML